MRAWVEAPDGWGPRQLLVTALERLGYRVAITGAGDKWKLVLS